VNKIFGVAILFICGTAGAAVPGPIYPHSDTENEQEFINLYSQMVPTSSIPTIATGTVVLTNGLIPNSEIDGSSITKQGNTFNGNNQLLQLGSTGLIPNSQIDGSSVTKLGNGNISFPGRVQIPLQPSFLAYNSTTRSNVTGDNTTVTVTFDTTQYDQASNFASNTFTAPVSGKYILSTGVTFRGETTGNKCELKIVTTAKTFVQEAWPSSNIALALTVVASMSSSDTATVTLNCSGGAKVVSIQGSNTTTTGAGEPAFFSGSLLN
jgi:hypothetical protein